MPFTVTPLADNAARGSAGNPTATYQYPTNNINAASGGPRDIIAYVNAVAAALLNQIFEFSAPAIATDKTKIKSQNTSYYTVNGQLVSLVATDPLWTLTGDAVTAGASAITRTYLLLLDAAGTGSVLQNDADTPTADGAQYAARWFGASPAQLSPWASVLALLNSASGNPRVIVATCEIDIDPFVTFEPGVTDLDAAGLTVTLQPGLGANLFSLWPVLMQGIGADYNYEGLGQEASFENVGINSEPFGNQALGGVVIVNDLPKGSAQLATALLANAALANIVTRAANAAGVATATTTSKVKTVSTCNFWNPLNPNALAATDNLWTLSGTVVPVSSFQKYALCVDLTGAPFVREATASPVSAAAVQWTNLNANNPWAPFFIALAEQQLCVIGVLTVATDATHPFTPGTTLLGAAGITATYQDGIDAAMLPLIGNDNGLILGVQV